MTWVFAKILMKDLNQESVRMIYKYQYFSNTYVKSMSSNVIYFIVGFLSWFIISLLKE